MNVSPSPTKPSSVCRRTQMMLGNSPRRMVSSCVIFMACLSDVGNVLSTPAQDHRVQAARRLDQAGPGGRVQAVSYTHLRAHETRHDLVCRLLLEKKKKTKK